MPVPREFLFGFLRLFPYRPVLYLFLSVTRSSVFFIFRFFLFPVFVLFLVSLPPLFLFYLKRLSLSGKFQNLSEDFATYLKRPQLISSVRGRYETSADA